MNYINAYLEEIESGRIKTSRRVYAVYKRLQKQQQSPPKGFAFYFDEEAGERPIEFIEKFCKQSQGIIGEPLQLQLFQKAFIHALFGAFGKLFSWLREKMVKVPCFPRSPFICL